MEERFYPVREPVTELVAAKEKAIETAANEEELFEKAVNAMKRYSKQCEDMEIIEEPWLLCDDIPLSYDEQETLQKACIEFDVPYALALGLIDTETNFNNFISNYCSGQDKVSKSRRQGRTRVFRSWSIVRLL